MNKKGYTFLGSNRLNVNAFFIRNDLINQVKLKIPQIENLSEYTKYKFNLIKNFVIMINQNLKIDFQSFKK